MSAAERAAERRGRCLRGQRLGRRQLHSPVTGLSLSLIEHWDGRAWTLGPSPAIRGATVLMGVAAASPDSAWADGGGGLIEHWDGRAWTLVPSPDLAGGGTLRAVAALPPASAWAVGTGSLRPGHALTTLIEHWDGRAWTLVPSPAAGDLTAVTETSPDSAWAVGSSSAGGGTAVIEHWDGKAWTWPPGFCASPPAPAAPCPPASGQQLRQAHQVRLRLRPPGCTARRDTGAGERIITARLTAGHQSDRPTGHNRLR